MTKVSQEDPNEANSKDSESDVDGSSNAAAVWIPLGIAIGTSLGTTFGVVFGNIGVGLAFGTGFGVAIGIIIYTMSAKR